MNAAALSLTPGTRVERFSIEERIAVGSSTITYRAREAGTGSYFVLREFLPDSGVTRSTEGALQPEDEAAAQEFAVGMAQFLAGAARLATLHHPSIARISRWFKANGTAYLVMPWPPGSSLAARLGEGQALDAPATVALAMPLLDALDYLHGQGFIHQELAPQTVQLLDSGGAALLGPGAGTAVQAGAHTAAGDANAYAAIEQARAGGIIGPWTDIYGLSACFYHCITGHAPAPAADRHAAVLSGLPDPLVAITLPAGASQAQREISTLVGRGLALEPSARPQSVREWRARVAYSPEASETTDPAAGAAHAAEGREWLPIILLVLFLAGIAGMAWYLFTDRSNGTGAETPSSTTTSARNAEEVERWRQALEAKNYVVQDLSLLITPQVPEDALAVIIAGATAPLATAEVEALATYLDDGGGLVVLADPLPGTAEDPLATFLASRWGLDLRRDLIVDLSSSMPLAAIAASYADHPVTEKLQSLATYFPTSRSLGVAPSAEGTTRTELILTGSNSWGETELDGMSPETTIEFNDGADTPGPLVVGATAEDLARAARLVVVGDSDFGANADFYGLGNGDLLVNSIDWAAGQDALISLTAKPTTERYVTPPSRQVLALVFIVGVVAIPGLFMILGLTTWWGRRSKA